MEAASETPVPPTEVRAVQISSTLFIVEAGIKLKLSEEAVATAAVFYHTFSSVMESEQYDTELVIMAALNLAAKVQEVPAKLSDVINTCYRCLHKESPPLEVGDLYWQLKDSVARYELLLLRALKFKLNIELPHRYLLHYLLALSRWVDEGAWQKSHVTTVAWAILQDSYHTTLCLRHPSCVIATAVVYLALHCCKVKVPGCIGGEQRELDAHGGSGREGKRVLESSGGVGREGRRDLEAPGGFEREGQKEWWNVCCPESSEDDLQKIATEIMAVYDARKQTT